MKLQRNNYVKCYVEIQGASSKAKQSQIFMKIEILQKNPFAWGSL